MSGWPPSPMQLTPPLAAALVSSTISSTSSLQLTGTARPCASATAFARGPRIARREEGACRAHVTDEQRSEAGCIGGQNGAVISGRALSEPPDLRRRLAFVKGWTARSLDRPADS